MNLQRRVWNILNAAKPAGSFGQALNTGILLLILLNVIAVIIESVSSIENRWSRSLGIFEAASVFMFTIEYLLRVWSCTIDPAFRSPVTGRLRFALQPMSLVDLLAIAPFYIPLVSFDMRSVRIFRLLRLVRIFKLGRYYSSLNLIKYVLVQKKEQLVLSTFLMLLALVFSSSILFHCENSAQPETFSSIPATMWWAVATLSTVGYGDMFPVTATGKFFAGLISIFGIGMFALPAGILGAGFVEASEIGREPNCCPHCGKGLGPAAIQKEKAEHEARMKVSN